MLESLARWCVRRKWLVILAMWLPLMVAINAVSGAVGTDFHTDFVLPDSESKVVQDTLFSAGDREAGGFTAQIVFEATASPQGVNDPVVKTAMEGVFDAVGAIPGVRVVSPYSPQGASFVSRTAPMAFAQLKIGRRPRQEVVELAKQVRAIGDAVHVDGLHLEYGSEIFEEFEFPESEVLGVLAAVLILLVAFGSVLAMGLPIGTALFGLGVGMAGIGLLSHTMSMPDFSPQMSAMIGLGVGIDYALFIVTRYREHLHAGESVEDSVAAALDASGRAVLFAGLTVMISLLGLMVIGLAFVRGLAVAGAVGVLLMMLAAVTLLPALLGVVGRRIDTTSRAAALACALFVAMTLVGISTGIGLGAAFGIGLLVAVAIVAVSFAPFGRSLRTPIPHRQQPPRQQQLWFRWSRQIQHRPWVALAGSAAALILLAIPTLSIRMGFSDTGNLATNQTARQAYDMLGRGFGPGFNGPLLLVSTDPALTQATAERVTSVVAADPGVAVATPPTKISDDVWFWQVFPKTAPQDEATTDLVHRLRGEVLPSTGAEVLAGGFTAAGVDFSTFLSQRLKILIAAVLILSFLLLMIVFRSILVPLKAVVMNLLSVGAAYGVIVAIFQWGWGAGLFGIGKPGPIESWVPMMLFAITFGLSMDYEVFLLSRIKEEYDRTGDNATAVADGLAATARVITAAALIMVCVFAAFVLGDNRQLKLFGLGLAVAVLVDATIVRMVLVPATMELLGDRNWWMPKWLDRLLPRVNVEGRAPSSAAAPTVAP